MTTVGYILPRIQFGVLFLAVAATVALFAALQLGFGGHQAVLLLIGVGLGISLYHAAFGFSAAYRRLIRDREISDVAAQAVMLATAIVLFAPVLAEGAVFGRPVTGAVAPVSVSMAFGAFLFGMAMQLAGGCASGTLYTAGGGNPRMLVVLVFFCIGGFWASLHLHWWGALPGLGAVSLGDALGWPLAVALQLVALVLIYGALKLWGCRRTRPLWWGGDFSWTRLIRGPWPLLMSAGLLAALNWLTLLVAGHPWSITWAFALWAAKAAVALGWDPGTSPFWSGGFQQAALVGPLLADTVTVMNMGILLGALMAASLAGRVAPSIHIPWGSLAAAAIGGLMLGYGARLAYGCNIGAFFSGVASGSLHGWVWIAMAVLGTMVGVRLRPVFGLFP